MNANLMTKRIEMTKTEAKNAGKPNTVEYNTLLELMTRFPGFPIEIVKTTNNKSSRFKGLNYDYMEKYIAEKNVNLLETFYELRGLDKDGKKVDMAVAASYGEIKMWFLTRFPEIEKMSEKVDKIIKETRKAREMKKTAA